MRFNRDAMMVLGLVVTMILLVVWASWEDLVRDGAPDLSTYSIEPTGAGALREWFDEMGYEVVDDVLFERGVAPPAEAEMAFILAPTLTVGELDWRAIDRWVERGGVLVVADDRLQFTSPFQYYEVDFGVANEKIGRLEVQNPHWRWPAQVTSVPVETLTHLAWEQDNEDLPEDMMIHLATATEPVMVSFPRGEGVVFLTTATHPFTNQGLKEVGSGEFVLNLLAYVPAGGMIWFDEWHHGIRNLFEGELPANSGPWGWLTSTQWGRVVLYMMVVIFGAVVLARRGFGRPVPLPDTYQRRSPVEYVTAVANLQRRAGHQAAVLGQYRQQLKRGLGQRYRINPTLPDQEFVQQLLAYEPDLDEQALVNLFNRLANKRMSEDELVRVAREVTDWLSN
ncbi:MAG TPA: DUF4350 domain-containing protein [Anaerolineae bacterium]|nr:DUF4350 domain-containing protein [Anaerolineae bacterium]